MGKAPRDESRTYQGAQFTAQKKGGGGGAATAKAFPAMGHKGQGSADATLTPSHEWSATLSAF